MTRVLACADTHIGKTLYKRSRLDEQANVLAEITAVAVRENIDFIIHAGDIMDSAVINPDALDVALRWFEQLHEAHIPIVLVLGNHEGWRYWSAHVTAYRDAFDLHIIDRPERVEIAGATVACMPWVFPHRLGSVITDEYEGPREYADTVAWLLRKLLAEPADILTTHMRFGGARLGQVERQIKERLVVPPRVLDDLPFKHLVAGDVHLRQAVGDRGGYIGAPMQLDFGEEGNETAATLIDTSTGESRTIQLWRRKTLLRLDLTYDEVECYDPADLIHPDDADRVLVHVHVRTNGPGFGIADYVADKYPWATKITVEHVDGLGLGAIPTRTPKPTTPTTPGTFPVLERLFREKAEKGAAAQ